MGKFPGYPSLSPDAALPADETKSENGPPALSSLAQYMATCFMNSFSGFYTRLSNLMHKMYKILNYNPVYNTTFYNYN
jgi:hypothetical protein